MLVPGIMKLCLVSITFQAWRLAFKHFLASELW